MPMLISPKAASPTGMYNIRSCSYRLAISRTAACKCTNSSARALWGIDLMLHWPF